MFTVFALLFTVAGIALFGVRRPYRFEPGWAWYQHLGGAFCLIAIILWVLVLVSLTARLLNWMWENMP